MSVASRLRQRIENGMYEPEEATWLESLLGVVDAAAPLRHCSNPTTFEQRFRNGTFDQYVQQRCYQCPGCRLHLALRAVEIPAPEHMRD